MPGNEPSEDETPRTSEFKTFQFGGADTEPVNVPTGSDIGDAMEAFNGLKKAQQAARRPANEDFVDEMAGILQDRREDLQALVAFSLLSNLLKTVEKSLGQTVEEETDPIGEETARALKDSNLFSITEEKVGLSIKAERRAEEWKEEESPPAPIQNITDAFLDEQNWREWAEWSTSHVLYWNRRDLNRRIEEEGDDPDNMPEEEWNRRFNQRLESEKESYISEAWEILEAQLADTLLQVLHESADGDGLSFFQIESLLGLHEDDAPAPRPETEEMDPEPFSGGAAELLADVFTSSTNRVLMEADGEPAPTYKGEWGKDSTGHPIRVEQLGNPYEGRATFKVQAFGEPDPAAVEASMGWKMLDRMDMDTVWLNLLLLSYASATHRRGERPTIRIGRRSVEKVFGYRNGNYTMKERAQKIRRHVEALQSIFVQFQNVRHHGDKLHFKGDMAGGAPLWNLRMVAEGEKDLFTGKTVADWHLEAREGLWATEFLHNHADQFTTLPKEWFKQIDRRGSRNYAQRLAAYLLFQFRINAKNGARVKRRAATLLEVCGEDMGKPRDTERRSELKRCLSKALNTLDRDYGIEVNAERVLMENTSGMNFDTWKNRTVQFAPPASIEGRIFKAEGGDAPPLPNVAGDWTPKQIRHLRTEVIGDTQEEFGEKLHDVTKQYISQLERGTSDPSTRIRKRLDALHSRYS